MAKAPAGALVSIYMDTLVTIREGDYIVTTAGRKYEVETVRRQKRGIHVGRQHMMVTVLPDDAELTNDARIHRLRWYKR